MSHHYNPYLTDQQSSAQGRYGHSSAQAQSDPQRTSHPNSGSSYRSAPSGLSPNIPSLLALPMPGFMAAQSRPVKEEEPKRSADLYSGRAREESLVLPRSYATTQPFQGHRKAVAASSDRSLNWLPTYKSTNEDEASKYYTSAASSIFPGGGESRTLAASSIFPGGGESRTSAVSSIFPGGGESRTSATSSIFSGGGESRTSAASSIFSGGGESRTSAASSIFTGSESRFTTIIERKPHEQSIPGLGEYEFPVRETASTQPEFSRLKYTSESAINILLHFGLEKEDLEQLISYPEDQITPKNLPFILRQIRQQKTKSPVSAVQAAPYPEPKPTTSVSDTDFRGHMKDVFHQDYRPPGILKTSKVIDYGHMSQFPAGPGEEVGMASGAHSVGNSTLLMDSSSREAKEMSMSSRISSCDLESSGPGLYSPLSFKLSSASLSTKNPPKQATQTASVPFTISKTDTGSRILPGASTTTSLKGPEPSQLNLSKPRLSDTPSPSVASGQLGLVLYDSLKDLHQPLKQVSKVPESKQKQLQQPPVKRKVKRQQPATQRSPTSRVDTARRIPTPAQMYDYVATTPGMYPHSCSLCKKECLSVKEWINHQNTELHLGNCKLLRTRFPEWDGELLTSLSASDVDGRSSTTCPPQSRKKRRNGSSRSRSQTYSPQRHRSSENRRDQARSRYRSRSHSNSPSQSSRRTRRSRSRSQSPLYRSTTSRYRSRSRSYERRSSPRRRDDRRSSAKRSRSWERRSLEKLSARQMPSDSAEALAQKLLGSSAIQALSNQSDLEAVVKTLAPALLAELTKMKTSPSSSSSCSASKKDPKTKTQPVSADDAASTVRLLGVLSSISHSHLEDTARLFGKPTSIIIFRKLKEAQVVFQKPEDADKMRNAKSHKLMGMRVKLSGGASSGSQTPAQERKKAPPTKTGKSRMSSSLSKAQNVRSKPAKVLESGKQKQAADSTTQSSAAKPSNTAAAKKPTGQPIKPTVVNKPSQPAKGSTSGPKAPAADKKDSTSSEKKTEQKDKEAAVKVEKPPDQAEKLAVPAKMSTLVEVLVKQESQEEEEKLNEEDADKKQKTGVLPLTMGEMMGKNLLMKRIACVEMKSIFSPEFASKNRRVLQITNLPKYENGNYTERDVVNLLTPFGFQNEDEHLHNIYVIPQKRMALAVLPTAEMAINVIRASVMDCFKLSGCKLLVKILEDNFSTPMEFYQSLMMWMNEKIHLHQEKRIIFIKNISPSEARNLREVLKKIDNVKNYAPLLNKVFIEFHMIHDADRLGVWYSLLNEPPQHSVYRLGTLRSTMASPLPKMAEKAIPDLSLRLRFTDVPMNSGIPLECGPPFFVTMTTFPFIFPTSCPWFNIPPCHNPSTVSSTIMMTCLPEDGYCQLDVARMVWNLLHQRNIISMFYRVMVLPLQRRAFIYFNTPESGREFSRRHSIKPFCIKDKPVKIYFVDHNMNPEFTEEEAYRQLMKWSNARFTLKSRLEHRLLLVLVSEVSLELIQAVMKEVSSVGRLAAFLPLGNRICIEMLEPSDWMKVMEAKLGSLTAPHIWKKVIRVDTLQSLHQRQLQSVNFIINLDVDPYWAATGQTAQGSNTISSSSTKPSAANTAPYFCFAPETSKYVDIVEQRSSGAVDADSDVANCDDLTRTKKLPEAHTPSKKRPVVLTLSKHCHVVSTPTMACPEGPKPSEVRHEGVKASVEHPEGLSAGLKPSKERTDSQIPSEKCIQFPTTSNEHLKGLKPTEKHPEGTPPSKEYSECPTVIKERPEDPKPTEEYPKGLIPSKKCSESPTPFKERSEGPKPPEKNPEGLTPSKECSEGPTRFKKLLQGPKPTEERPEGSVLSKECSEGPTLFKEHPEGPKLTKEHPDSSTPSKECCEGPTPFKECREVLKPTDEHPEGSTSSKECSEGPTPLKKRLEGPKPIEETPEGSTQSKECSDGPTSFKECLKGLKLSEVCSEGSVSLEECLGGSTPSKECSEELNPLEERCEGLAPSKKHLEGPTESKEHLECMMPSQKCPGGPEPSEEQSKGPILSGELPQGPTSTEEQSGSLTPSTKFPQVPTPTQELPQGPTLSEELPQGPTQTQELPQVPTLSEQLLQCLIPTEKCPQGPTPIEKLPQGPTSSMEQSECLTRSEECPEDPTTSKQPKTEIEERPPMGEDKIKAILAAIQQHKQTKAGKVPMGFTADVKFSDRDDLHFEQDTDEFVTLDEVSDDTKDTAKNTQSSNSSKQQLRRRGQTRSHSKTSEQESKSSNKSDRASERSRSPLAFQRRQRDSCTTTTRDKTWSPERRSHRGRDKSRSPQRRSHRGRDKSRSPEGRSHRSRDVSRSPEGRPYRNRDNSSMTERTSHRRKDKSRSPDRRSHRGRGKSPTTEHRSYPGKDKSPNNKFKEKSSSTKRNSEPDEEESSSIECKERSKNTECRSEQEKTSNNSLAALSAVGLMMLAVNTAAEPEKGTPVEAPKEGETSVTQSPKSEEKQEDEMENYQILDLFEDREEKSQLPSPEEDQSLDGLSFQVLDSIDDEGTAEREESVELKTDTSFQVLDSVTEDQSATDHVTEVAVAENVSDETEVSKIAKRQGRAGKRGRKPKVLITNKDMTDQEHFEVIDSVEKSTETKDPELISQAPNDVTPEAELELIKAEEVYQVIDSVDEQSAPNAKKKEGRRGRPTRRSARGRTSEGESVQKQDETQTKSEATKPDSITNKEGANKVPCPVLNSAGSETIQETQKVGRRRSTRGKKEEKITSQTASRKEEPKYQVIDLVEDDVAPEEAVTVTRSTRGRRGRPAKRDIPTRMQTAAKECEEVKETSPKIEDMTVTVEEATYKVIDSVKDEGTLVTPPVFEQNRKRGRPRNAKASSKPFSSKKAKVKIEAPTYQIIDSVEEETAAKDQEISDNPGTAEKSSTPEDNYDKQKITKSGCEEEPMYQIVDSVEDDPVPDIVIPGTIKGSTAGKEEQNDVTNFTEDKNHESSTSGSSLVILDKEAKELEMNYEEPGSLSSSIEERRSKEIVITAFEAKELLTLDEVSVDEAPEEDGSERKEEGDQEDPSNQSSSIKERWNMEMEISTFEAQELLTLDEVSADEAPEESEADGSERNEEMDQEEPGCQSSNRETRRSKEMEITAFEAQELLTLDEVGADEAPEKGEKEGSKRKEEENQEEPKNPSSSIEERRIMEIITIEAQELLTLDEVSADEAPEDCEEDSLERKKEGDQEEPGSQSSCTEARRNKEMEITAFEAQELLTLDEVGADEAPEEDEKDGSKRKEEEDQEEPKNPSSRIEEHRNTKMEITAVEAQELLTLDEVSADEAPEDHELDSSEKKKEGDQEETGSQSKCIEARRSKEMEITAFEAQELLTLDEVGADEAAEKDEKDSSKRKEEEDQEEPKNPSSSIEERRITEMEIYTVEAQELLTLDEVSADEAPEDCEEDGLERKKEGDQEEPGSQSSCTVARRNKEMEITAFEAQELLTLDEVGADEAPEEDEKDGSKRKEEGDQDEPKNQSGSIEERRNTKMEITAVEAQELLTLDEVSADEAPEDHELDSSEKKKEGDQEEPGSQSSCIEVRRSKEMEITTFEAQELLTLDEVSADEAPEKCEEDYSERKKGVNHKKPGSQSSSRKTRRRKVVKMTKMDVQELLTLDEVGADDAPGEREADGSERKENLKQEADLRSRSSSREGPRRKEVEMHQVDTQELLTLDEVGADNAPEQPKVKRPKFKEELPIYDKGKDRLISENGQSLDPLNSETLAEVDREKDEDHRHNHDIKEESDFIMLDEAVDDEEEVDPRPNTATLGRKEGKEDGDEETLTKESQSDELAASHSTQQISNAEANASSQSDKGATVSMEEGKCEVKVVDERRKELVGPEAKRSRSQSPDVPADFMLPMYNPSNSLGQEFVVPKAGFFCNICSIFYVNENTAKKVHCSSRRHYDNLKKYYLKLKTTPSRASSPSSSNVSSDDV